VGSGAREYGNMHDYFSGHNPGSPGWGGQDQFGVYGSLAYFIAIAQQTTGQAPMWSTETGYGDATGQPMVRAGGDKDSLRTANIVRPVERRGTPHVSVRTRR
jgi:hypothetical protein